MAEEHEMNYHLKRRVVGLVVGQHHELIQHELTVKQT